MIRDSRNLKEKRVFLFQTTVHTRHMTEKFCTVIGRVDEGFMDFEDVGTMWRVRMADGTELQAFADEVNLTMSPKEFIQKYMGDKHVSKGVKVLYG